MGFSLEDGAIGYRLGKISIANMEHFYPPHNDSDIPGGFDQSFMAKLYADTSLSFPETNTQNQGSEDEYELEDLGTGWRYHVCQARPRAQFRYSYKGGKMLMMLCLEL